MVAISNIILLGTAILCAAAAAPKAAAPVHTPEDMAKVMDCQTQCISLVPPFGHKPDYKVDHYMAVKDYGRMPYLIKNIQPIVQPCLRNITKADRAAKKVSTEKFEAYVLCNSKTLTKNETPYFAKNFNWKKNGFNQQQWTQFRNHTLPGFRRALHKCRGGCRKIHFPKAK